MTTLTFGKYKGSKLSSVPSDYLDWGVNNLDSPKWKSAFKDELSRRKNKEAEEKEYLKNNLDNPEILQILFNKAIVDINNEASNSGCEWEYNSIADTAQSVAKEDLKKLQTEVAIEKLEKEFAVLGISTDILKKIEQTHYGIGLEPSQFSSEEKYNLAVEYINKLEKIIDKSF